MSEQQRQAFDMINAMPVPESHEEPNVANAMANDLVDELRWAGVDPELVRKAQALAQATR